MLRNAFFLSGSPSTGVLWINQAIEVFRRYQLNSNRIITPINHCYRVYSASLSTLPHQEDNQVTPQTTEEATQKNKRKSRKKSDLGKSVPGRPLSPLQQITLDYITEHTTVDPELLKLIPRQFLRHNKTTPTSVYLANESVANQMAEIIVSEAPNLKSPVVELHPGIGLLTDQLINNVGFKYVTCFEDDANLLEKIKNSLKVSSLVDTSIDDLPRYYQLDKVDGGERINNIINQITTGPSSTQENQTKRKVDSPNLYVIGVLPHVSAINFLIRCYVTQRVLFDEHTGWSGITFFVGLGCKPDLICRATQKSGLVAYRATTVLFKTLFKMKEIGSFPRQAFIPWEVEDKVHRVGCYTRKLKVEDQNIVKFFRIEVNLETQKRIGKENLFTYWYFVRHCMYARRSKIIPELEKWIPGCGVRLIKQGHTIFSTFGEKDPEEILDLYLQFVSWPEFANSSFLNAVEKYQTRLEISEEEDVDN